MDKEKAAIQRLQEASTMSFQIYGRPLIVTTSGGKDSSVCVALARRAGIPFEVLHNHTTADAPETVYFMRGEFRRLENTGIKCTIEWPKYKGKRTSMWELIRIAKSPPSRFRRYCCTYLKEQGGKGRLIATGVRWAESRKRAANRGIYEAITVKKENKIILNNDNDEKRRLFETCQLKAKRVVNPIIDWSDRDVWDYIKTEKIPYNPLYECGFDRVGCVGCPLAGKRKRIKDFARYPKYKELYILAFDRMIEARGQKRRGDGWKTGDEVFRWWIEDGVLPGQIDFDNLITTEYEEAEP